MALEVMAPDVLAHRMMALKLMAFDVMALHIMAHRILMRHSATCIRGRVECLCAHAVAGMHACLALVSACMTMCRS